MNPKYTPATYFGAFMFVVYLIILQKIEPHGLNGSNIALMLICAAIGAIIAGFLFSLCWNWFKKRQAKSKD
jgi:hypothetical protein